MAGLSFDSCERLSPSSLKFSHPEAPEQKKKKILFVIKEMVLAQVPPVRLSLSSGACPPNQKLSNKFSVSRASPAVKKKGHSATKVGNKIRKNADVRRFPIQFKS
jgi:hypothetical protein